MSRFFAGVGGMAGVAGGAALGSGLGELYAGNFSRTPTEGRDGGMVLGALIGGALGAALGAGPACPPAPTRTGVGEPLLPHTHTKTPAQASGHQNFVTDVPVQGPTDEGIRAADCWFAQNRVPAHPACVDCGGGLIPMWAQTKGLLGEQISFGGTNALGFAGLGKAGDPEVWTKLTVAQQTWVMNALVKLNDMVARATYSKCPTFGPSITAAGGCFQIWWNWWIDTNKMPATKLRTDGVFDQDTLNALITTTKLHAADFPEPFPSAAALPPPLAEKKKLSTGAMAGIAAAGAAGIGGIIYVATRKSGRKRGRGRKR